MRLRWRYIVVPIAVVLASVAVVAIAGVASLELLVGD
jgi:hypothetical protein